MARNTSTVLSVLMVIVASRASAQPRFLDEFEYVAARDDPAVASVFQAHGWTWAKTQQSANARGYLHTVASIPGFSGSFPGRNSSRVLLLEARPSVPVGGQAGQTDFFLQLGDGASSQFDNYIPGNVWFQFWIYSQYYGNELSRYGSHNKFFYMCNSSYPCHSHLWMLGQGSPNYFDANDTHPLGDPSNGEFFWIFSSASGQSSLVYTGGDPYSTDQIGHNRPSVWVRPNQWTLVKMHMNTTSTTGNTWEVWLRPYGGNWAKVSDWVGGVTPQFTWDVPASAIGGHRVFRMPTTVGGPTNQWYDYWLYMDDFAMADAESDLPIYSDGGGRRPAPPTSIRVSQ